MDDIAKMVLDGMRELLTNEYFDLLFPNRTTPDPMVDERVEKLAA